MRNENDACGPRDLVTSKKDRALRCSGLFWIFFRARARARSIMRLYHSIPVNALLGQEFGKWIG
jgi:hypothetical protein